MPDAERTPAPVLRFDDVDVALDAALLHKRGVRIRLREKPFQVLASPLEHPGHLVTGEDLQRPVFDRCHSLT